MERISTPLEPLPMVSSITPLQTALEGFEKRPQYNSANDPSHYTIDFPTAPSTHNSISLREHMHPPTNPPFSLNTRSTAPQGNIPTPSIKFHDSPPLSFFLSFDGIQYFQESAQPEPPLCQPRQPLSSPPSRTASTENANTKRIHRPNSNPPFPITRVHLPPNLHKLTHTLPPLHPLHKSIKATPRVPRKVRSPADILADRLGPRAGRVAMLSNIQLLPGAQAPDGSSSCKTRR